MALERGIFLELGSAKARLTLRLALGGVLSLVAVALFLPRLWASLSSVLMAQPELAAGLFVSPWLVLGLGLLTLWLKRQELWGRMQEGAPIPYQVLGVALAVAGLLLAADERLRLLPLLLVLLGLFVGLFGRAAFIPAILVGIYGFAQTFPLLVTRVVATPYAMTTLVPVAWGLKGLGHAVSTQGLILSVAAPGGQPVQVLIAAWCAAPVALGLFLALFALMALDTRLPLRPTAGLFLLGLVGTWLQNVVRIIALLAVGTRWGERLMWAGHEYSTMILFPLWYLAFAYIYLWVAAGYREPAPSRSQ